MEVAIQDRGGKAVDTSYIATPSQRLRNKIKCSMGVEGFLPVPVAGALVCMNSPLPPPRATPLKCRWINQFPLKMLFIMK